MSAPRAALDIDEDADIERSFEYDSSGSDAVARKAVPTPAKPGQSKVSARVSVVFELVG